MSSHANHAANSVVKSGKIAAGAGMGSRILHTAAKHPVLLFGIGVVAGAFLYKYRQQINEASSCCESDQERP